MNLLVDYLIFPGLMFTVFIGGWGWWLERKLTARFQYRIGPPWYQNFIDIMKLFLKETVISRDADKTLFILSPIISFSSAALVAFIINRICFLREGFLGDIFAILYLLIIPSLFVVIGAFSSNNPLATIGATREIKLMLAYEFVFIVSLIIVIVKSNGAFSLQDIVSYQTNFSSHFFSASGFIGAVCVFFYLLAKLGIVPFDVAEAEQEIMGGAFIEYSGPLLGFYKLSKVLLYFSLPLLIVALFFGKNLGWHVVYKYLIVVFLISVVKNTNPRLRIGDIMSFFWLFLFPLGCLGIVLAVLGL